MIICIILFLLSLYHNDIIITYIISSKYRHKIPLDSKALHFPTKGLDFPLLSVQSPKSIARVEFEITSFTFYLKRTFLPGQVPTCKGAQ